MTHKSGVATITHDLMEEKLMVIALLLYNYYLNTLLNWAERKMWQAAELYFRQILLHQKTSRWFSFWCTWGTHTNHSKTQLIITTVNNNDRLDSKFFGVKITFSRFFAFAFLLTTWSTHDELFGTFCFCTHKLLHNYFQSFSSHNGGKLYFHIN